jgi:hypothetical protein
MLSSVEAYSQAVYALLDLRDTVRQHTIRIYSRGARLGVLEGQIEFAEGLVLRVFERLDFARQRIMTYSYEIWRDQQQLCWYDPQEHPHDASLATSFPHHQHVPPDIKHHRVPAPRLSFDHPNLPFLIAEVERLL